MYVAISKRKENIAEYVLYLWQLEDLFRALQFSPEAIFSQLVKPRDIDDAAKQELFLWYMDVANLLQSEGKESSGHLEHTMHIIGDLNNLHLQLLELPIGERYREIYLALAPELPNLRKLLENQQVSDIELCFRALYAIILYRIKGSENQRAIEDVIAFVSPVIAELSNIFRKVEIGEIDLFKK